MVTSRPHQRRTETASSGAARYHRISSSEEEMEGALIHYDEELQGDAVANGDAIRGRIVKVEDRSPEGSRAVIPVWTVEASSAGTDPDAPRKQCLRGR